jgi:glycerate kinase
LTLLPDGQPAPLTASSHGTGQLIAAALDAGCRTIVLGVGGSACTDGGAGMLTALGARLLGADGLPLPPGGAALVNLAALDLSTLDGRVGETTFVLASDVDNPLLGPHGAAAVYGPQKGASPEDVALLETGLARLAQAVAEVTGRELASAPGAGAAGGVGFAALAVLAAAQRPGIEVVLDLVGLADQLDGAALVVTGEGRLDTQSLHGKAPIGVARAAARAGVPVLAVAGSCELDAETLRAAGISGCYPLTDIEPELARSKANAAPLLTQVATRLARAWLTLDADPA